MPTKFETPQYDVLLAEQDAVQAGKFQGRLLTDYNDCMFPTQDWQEPRSCAVTDFVRPYCDDDKRVSLEGVLRGLSAAKSQPVNWVDMAGGRGLAMRQMAVGGHNLRMTNVDLFDFGLAGLDADELVYIDQKSPGSLADAAAPHLIRADVETVQLPEPADIITCTEAVQYLNNPLAAVANWYNQLADNGLLVVSAEHEWAGWIRYTHEPGKMDWDETPSAHLLAELGRTAVPHAATYEPDWHAGMRPDFDPTRFRTLALQKQPGTRMAANADVNEVWVNPYNYKAIYYEELPGAPPVAVLPA
jgi:hypothetical protein